jgi:hypothetical protein
MDRLTHLIPNAAKAIQKEVHAITSDPSWPFTMEAYRRLDEYRLPPMPVMVPPWLDYTVTKGKRDEERAHMLPFKGSNDSNIFLAILGLDAVTKIPQVSKQYADKGGSPGPLTRVDLVENIPHPEGRQTSRDSTVASRGPRTR